MEPSFSLVTPCYVPTTLFRRLGKALSSPLIRRRQGYHPTETDALYGRTEKADEHGMYAPTVGQNIVTQRIMTNDTFALGIDGGQSNDPPDRARFGQFRMMEIRTSGEHISILFDERSPATLIKGKA